MASLDELRKRHVQRLGRRVEALERRSRRFSRARLAVVILGAVLLFWIFHAFDPAAGLSALAAVVVGFTLLVKCHDRVEQSLEETRLLKRIKELHERRRTLDWDALPLSFEEGSSDPFAIDLNIVGPRSLHHLLDSSGTAGGSARLREWLVDPVPDFNRTMGRQRLVRQMVPLRIFRDHLARVAVRDRRNVSSRWDDRSLRTWLARKEVAPNLMPWVVGLGAFAAANVILIVAHAAGVLPAIWPATVIIYFAVYFMQHRKVNHLFDEAQDLDLTLQRVMPPLIYLEQFRFEPGSAAALVLADGSPSAELKNVRRIASAAALTRNEFLWLLLNLVLPWDLLFTYLMHRAKRAIREHLPAWLEAWYTLEAASALASYADYHERRTFPVLTPPDGTDASVFDGTDTGVFDSTDASVFDGTDTDVFDGRELGHPLIYEDVKVRNDFSVDRLGEVILITGSNMSGKSTFLRTLGINLRLAYAGAPVDATSLRTPCFRVLTSINVVDSIQQGLSHFYAEVRRLKLILDGLDSELPLFNLIDEIFRGTNNRERLIGSRSFVRALAGRNAVSVVSTHDLELTRLEGEIDGLRNFHFREDIRGGRMTFDYQLREGPSPTTNALKIMAAAGLPVDSDAISE